jgi:ADP-ribosyl-[dinitrogen reductase] hydrolase
VVDGLAAFDIGTTTSAALDRFLATGNPMAGSTHPRSAGNGAIMRLAPAVIAFAPDAAAAERAAVLQGRTTHAAPECDLFASRLARLLLTGDLDAAEDAPPGDAPPDTLRASGWVRHCWEAAVWAVRGADSFEAAVLRAVNLGEDADTTGAVAGQIAGRIFGATGIPAHWTGRLACAARSAETSIPR